MAVVKGQLLLNLLQAVCLVWIFPPLVWWLCCHQELQLLLHQQLQSLSVILHRVKLYQQVEPATRYCSLMYSFLDSEHQKQHYVPYYLSIVLILSIKYAFWDHKYVFHLGKVFYRLVDVSFNLLHPCFLPYVQIYCISECLRMSHKKCPHMVSLVYYEIWDFQIFFRMVPYSLQVHNVRLQTSKMSLPFFSFLSNNSCINHLTKSFLSSFSILFLIVPTP